MKQHFPSRNLMIIFEPHTFSWRNRGSLTWYDTVFEGASKVYIYEPASQGASTHAQLSQEEILDQVTKTGIAAERLTNPDLPLSQNDAILFLTSGNLGGLMEPIITYAEEKFPK